MARKGTHRRQVKGFRPGKEPAHIKKRIAKAQLGSDATWAQKKAVEAFAGRSPKEVERIVRRWILALAAGAAVLGALGVFLYRWSVIAGAGVHVVTAVLFFLAYRLRKQMPGLVGMADSIGR
jgi:hypothetical protein